MIPQAVRDATILVVDDEPVNLKLLEALLGGAGYTSVTSTTDPRRVLELYHRLAPDLVMLDLRMPYLDGFAVMRQLRQAQPQGAYLPILMLTAEVATQSKQRALSEGATDFLHKPFDPVEVLLRIANLLETRRLHAELRLHNDLLEQRIRERTAEIERARADIAQIAHAAAHDLVEPVRTVAVNAQLLAQHSGQALDGDAARCVDYVVEGSTRSYELLGDLLDYAQAASDTRADVPVDCRAIVERVVQQHAWRIAQSNATVTVECLATRPTSPRSSTTCWTTPSSFTRAPARTCGSGPNEAAGSGASPSPTTASASSPSTASASSPCSPACAPARTTAATAPASASPAAWSRTTAGASGSTPTPTAAASSASPSPTPPQPHHPPQTRRSRPPPLGE